MIGNPKLGEMGFGEEALGHNAIAGGFRDNGNGRISCPMATSRKPFSIRRSTGMEGVSHLFCHRG